MSEKIKNWHDRNKNTGMYELRRNKTRESIFNTLKETHPDYIPRSILNENRIKMIESLYNVRWDELTIREKNKYGVMLSKNYPEYKKRNAIIELNDKDRQTRKKLSDNMRGKKWITNGHENRYIDFDGVLPDGFYFGRTQDIDKNHKVLKIEKVHKPCRVYDLEIEDNHNFALAAGVFVHNSKDISDSLAGAFYNALSHKQSLIDAMQLFSSSLDVNADESFESEFMGNLQASMSGGNTMTKLASDKLDELLNGYGGGNLISW